MLVLSRTVRERVIINVDGKLITVTLIEAGQGRCRLGFEADKDIKIDREERLLSQPAGQ